MSGDTVVVYARGSDVGNTRDQGAAYVFVVPPGGWVGLLTENAKLVASDGAANDFGSLDDALGVSDDTVVVGPPAKTSAPIPLKARPISS